jgi:hypothetical protein
LDLMTWRGETPFFHAIARHSRAHRWLLRLTWKGGFSFHLIVVSSLLTALFHPGGRLSFTSSMCVLFTHGCCLPGREAFHTHFSEIQIPHRARSGPGSFTRPTAISGIKRIKYRWLDEQSRAIIMVPTIMPSIYQHQASSRGSVKPRRASDRRRASAVAGGGRARPCRGPGACRAWLCRHR